MTGIFLHELCELPWKQENTEVRSMKEKKNGVMPTILVFWSQLNNR